MFEIEVVNKKGMQLINSRLLHKKLGVASYHKDWMRRRIENYGFVEGQDYFCCTRMSGKKGSGGSNRKDYLLTLDMAKELCMLENNDIGKQVRKYFISIEKEYRELYATRRTRLSLTDSIKLSDENERMNGHAYSTYTLMIYEIVGIKPMYMQYKKTHGKVEGFRSTLSEDELKRVSIAEGLVKPLLEMEKQYSEIKDTLKPLFEVKEIN